MRKSRARNFRKGVPVQASFRVIDRRLLLTHPDIRNIIRRELARAPQYEVDLESMQIRGNHVHLILRQHRDGSNRPGTFIREDDKTGISHFMMVALSQISREANACVGREGRFIERTYQAHTLENAEQYLRSLAYLEAQDEHHGPYINPDDEGPYRTDVPLLPDTVDGLVTAVPDLPFLADLMDQVEASDPTADHHDDPWYGQTSEDAIRCRALSRALGRVIDRAIDSERIAAAKEAEQQAHRVAAAKAHREGQEIPTPPPYLAPEDEYRARRPWQEAIEQLTLACKQHGIDLTQLSTVDYLPTPIKTLRPHRAHRDDQLRAHHLAFHCQTRRKHRARPAPREGQTIHYVPVPPKPHPAPD